MEEEPQVNIGTIGYVDHSKHTLIEAIKIVLENNITKEKDECSYKMDVITEDKGETNMIKGIKNYTGSTILGYRFVLDKNSSKKIKYTKGNSKIKNSTMHNKVKVLNKRRDYSK